MSTKNTKKTSTNKVPTRKKREYSDLTMILIVVALVVLAIVLGNIVKKPDTVPSGTTTDVPELTQYDPTPSGMTTDVPELKQYDTPPAMTIDTGKQYLATVKMANGANSSSNFIPTKHPSLSTVSYSCHARGILTGSPSTVS